MRKDFPLISNSTRYGEPLQAPGFRRLDKNGVEEIYSGNLTYLEFIALVKKLWEESYPTIPIFPLGINREATIVYQDSGTNNTTLDQLSSAPSITGLEEFPAIIGYSLELRKTHTTEPKPRMRQNVLDNAVTVYGQKYQNIISFTVMAKSGTLQGDDSTTRDDLDTAVLCDQVMESFEDFMLEYTPILKAAGASDLVYSRRLSDSDVDRNQRNLHKRTVTYMLTTEKTFAIKNERIKSIAIDVRTWMAIEKEIVSSLATPNYEDITINIVDLNQTDTSE
jgi:hypothetical protein